jgi:5-oxoprolinase (ATP-hydrolysing)
VAVRVNAADRTAEIDFTGTSAQLSNNFNAPKAVCMAAVLYVFRSLVDDDIPLNAGCLKPLKVIIPQGSMLNPTRLLRWWRAMWKPRLASPTHCLVLWV